MQSSLDLLIEINQVLMRLHDTNRDMLDQIRAGLADKIELHVEKRQALLDILDVLESHLEKTLSSTEKDRDLAKIAKEIKLRRELLEAIVNQEFDANKLLELEKQKVILELQSLQKNKKVVSAYKSGNKRQNLDKEF